ncbi:MAG TPA: PRC-barrel domain-containing protein [Azospirillum sp.]|nr:PRC-barrel domain-containing protein [Azospirillum sp.]
MPTTSVAQQGQQGAPQDRPGQRNATNIDQQCLQQLRQLNQSLVEGGYGLAGPRGYPGYGVAPAAGTAGTVGGPAASPRGEMRTLMNAGYVLAVNGYGDGCRTVIKAAQELQRRYTVAMDAEGGRGGEFRTWRTRYLTTALPVTQLEAPLRIDEVIGSDLRNHRDEDLGDIEDVVLGPQGGIRYVLVGRGGFLGIGEELVPVRWKDLRVTANPYRDTFVLNVPETAFENAPSLGVDPQTQMAAGGWAQNTDRYWDQQLAQYGTQPPAAGSSGAVPPAAGSNTGSGKTGGQ